MYYPENIKHFPIAGLAGFGGGASGLLVAGGGGASTAFAGGDRGFKMGGRIPNPNGSGSAGDPQIDYINITSEGNGNDFGDLTSGREHGSHNVTNGNKCLYGAGWSYNPNTTYSKIDKFTPSTLANATNFGDFSRSDDSLSGNADVNIDRGFLGPSYADQDQLEYVTISTDADSVDFGTLIGSGWNRAGTCNGITGWWHGGNGHQGIDYLTTATLSNAADWGDLHKAYQAYGAVCSVDASRVIQLGGYHGSPNTYGDWIEYYTTASTGNGNDFGDLTAGRAGIATAGNGTRAVAMGGYESGGPLVDTMDYVTIATLSDASNFGDLSGNDRAFGGSNSGNPS